MVSNPPKVSFIPKSPLTREESFMNRRRPRSITGFLAIFSFVVSIGSYAGLYFYESTLSKEVEKKAAEIASIQSEFLQSPEIDKAKIFQARADLAKELLDQHIAVSPVFSFLSSNTLGSILYDSFDFKKDNNVWIMSLTGEAPSYASLAYQTDVLKKKNKENGFVDFSISNIALTKSGTVTFALSVDFAQSQLAYSKKDMLPESSAPLSEVVAPAIPSVVTNTSRSTTTAESAATPLATTTIPETIPSVATTSPVSGWTIAPVVVTPATSKAVTPTVAPAPAKSSFWSWFKFW